MAEEIPKVKAAGVKLDAALSTPSSSSSPSSSTAATISHAPKAIGAIIEDRKWNTKNLGLRLAADCAGAASAALLIAPIVTIIDRSIMENASGRNSLKDSLLTSFTSFMRRPQSLLFSKPFGLICLLYGGTYLTANTLDTAMSTVQGKPATLVTSGTLKFAASSTANISLCIFKDQVFVKLFGPRGGAPRPVPLPSYALFTLRDCLTIFASFNVPPLLGPALSARMGAELQRAVGGQTLAQFLAPAGVQLLSTPLHLLGLDLYNRGSRKSGGGSIGWSDRWEIVRKNWAVSSLARIGRIVPAYGVGGVVNAKVRGGLMEGLV